MMTEPFIPLSILSLDLDEPGNGWAASLAARDIKVQIDDIGRASISRADARRLFTERREAVARQREITARNDAKLEGQRVFRGLPADQIPAGMTAAEALMAGDPDLAPRRKSAAASFLDGDSMVMHTIREPLEDVPGFGPFLGAALLVGAGDLRAFPSAGHLAAAAGLVPVPNDSGRRTGNLHRPHRYSRPLRHVFYLSAQTSMMRAGPNRDYYLKKRAHGRTHSQAVISLARRRVDVLWSLLRDNRHWVVHPPEHSQAA